MHPQRREGDDKLREVSLSNDEEAEAVGAIDQLYDILEMLEDDVNDLETATRERVNVFRYQGIFEAVSFLDELGMSSRLGLSAMDLDKFQRMSGMIDNMILRQMTGRLKSLLREAEGTIRSIAAAPIAAASPPARQAGSAEASVQVVAVEWVSNDRDKNADLIADLTELLDDAVTRARGTNLPPQKAAFTEFQRKALIDLLETAVLMLKGPLVEKGLLQKLGDAAGDGAATAVKKGAEVGLGFVLKRLWGLLTQFLGGL